MSRTRGAIVACLLVAGCGPTGRLQAYCEGWCEQKARCVGIDAEACWSECLVDHEEYDNRDCLEPAEQALRCFREHACDELGGLDEETGSFGACTEAFRTTVGRCRADVRPGLEIDAPVDGELVASTFTVRGRAWDANLEGVVVAIDGGTPTAAAGTTQWTYEAVGLFDGHHTVTAWALDSAGHNWTSSVAVIVDAVPPTVTIEAPENLEPLSSSVRVHGTAYDPAGVSRVEVTLDGGTPILATGTNVWSVAFTELAEGVHEIGVLAHDELGNVGRAAARRFIVDETDPTVRIDSPHDGQLLPGQFVVSGTASDVTLTKVELSVDGELPIPVNGFSSWSLDLTLPAGLHSLMAVATDRTGKRGATTVVVSIDDAPPTITVIAPNDGDVVDSTSSLVGTAEDDSGIDSVDVAVDGGVRIAATGGDSWSVDLQTGLADGVHTVTVFARDVVGNEGMTVLRLELDGTAPVVTIDRPVASGLVPAGVTVSGMADDANLLSVAVSVDGASAMPATGLSAWRYPLQGLSAGSHVLTVVAADAVGHQSAASVDVTVDPTLPEVLIVTPAHGALVDSTVVITGTASATSGIALVDVSVDRGEPIVATGTATWSATLTELSDGPHTLVAAVNDVGGNTTEDVVVVVVDEAPPSVQITSPANGALVAPDFTVSGVASDATLAGVTVSIDGGSPKEASGLSAWALDVVGLADGLHTVQVVATDARGHVSSDSVVIWVGYAVVSHVSAGGGATCALFVDSSVKCWGYNRYGALGLEFAAWAIGDGSGEMGDNLPYVALSAGTIVRVVAGVSYSCVLFEDGRLQCWGVNGMGQLGYGDTVDRGSNLGDMGDNLPTVDVGTDRTVVDFALGREHVCALLDDGSVKCWGRNDLGQLGLSDVETRGDESGEMGDDLPTVDLGSGRIAVQIAAGYDHTCALLDDGTVKCWGANGYGALGLGDRATRGDDPGEMGDNLSAVDLGTGLSIGEIHAAGFRSCAVFDDRRLKCWGRNAWGELGLGDGADRGDAPGEMGDALPWVDLGAGRTVVSLSGGFVHTCALLDDDTIRCWGRNQYGQLGEGTVTARGDLPDEMGDNLPVVQLGTGRRAMRVDAGHSHACVLLDNGRVKCWGYNSDGELGLEDNDHRGDGPGEMGDALPYVILTGP